MSLEIYPRGPAFTSSTLSDFGAGVVPGTEATFPDSTGLKIKYTLVKAAGTIPDDALVKKHTTSNTFDVVVTEAVGSVADRAVGVNNTGASISSGTYFWMVRGPKFTVLDAAGGITTVGEGVGLHATTDGNADTLSATAGHQCIGSCLVASSGGIASVWGTIS